MSVLLQTAIGHLKKRTLSLAARVEQALADAITAFRQRDDELGISVVNGDQKIDALEVRIEEECLKVLALHQPVAVDLRFVIAVIKLNNDLERIADLAADLAERASSLARQPMVPPPSSLDDMPDAVLALLRLCLDAVVNVDADRARAVCQGDDAVDELHRQTYQQVSQRLAERPEQADTLIQYLSVSRYLERIADHCTNIAEDVIYLVEGQIVRHEATRRLLRQQETAARDEGASDEY